MTQEKINDSSFLVKLPEEDKDEFQENTENMSETLRYMIRSYNEMGGGYDIDDELDEVSVVILKTYRNAIEQNIQVMKAQRDKIGEEIERYEDDEHEEQVLVEVDLDIATKNL